MVRLKNNLSVHVKSCCLAVSLLLTLVFSSQAFTAPVSYIYDSLNRLISVDYGNGQQVITYSYDAAGNVQSKTTTNAEQLAPTLSITSPENGAVINSLNTTIIGTASDAGRGDSGIASVNINALPVMGGSATGGATANWSLGVGLVPGTNVFSVVATDASAFLNQATQNLSLIALPPIIDTDGDGIPNIYEDFNRLDSGIDDAAVDADGDGVTNIEEYNAGTDPQLSSSVPEGTVAINYVPFRDHFNDNLYEDRWQLASADLGAVLSLTESGTILNATLGQPLAGCQGARLQGFGSTAATNASFQVLLEHAGTGKAVIGLMAAEDYNNRLEVIFDYENSPYLYLRSWVDGVVTEAPANIPTNYQGNDIDLRLIKVGSAFTLIVNDVTQASGNNVSLESVNLRPYIAMESCVDDTGYVDVGIDLVELLLDRDGDGLPDLNEDTNFDGAVDDNESDPLNEDSDVDTVMDGFDNCPITFNPGQEDSDVDGIGDACEGPPMENDFDGDGVIDSLDNCIQKANASQLDIDNDGFGNACDGDLNNDRFVNSLDLGLFKQSFFTSGELTSDFDGNGIVNSLDLGAFKQMFFQPPGPSGIAQ